VGTRGCALGLALGVLALTGCGSNGTASPPTITATAPATTGAPSPEGGQIVRALTLDQLRKLVLSAVRAESSVHLAMGNLNPPPSTEVDQDYSTQGGDLRVVVKLEPGSILMEGRRTGGEVYMSFDGKPFQHVPAQEMSKAEPTPLIALFRTDVAKDLTAIFAATVRADFRPTRLSAQGCPATGSTSRRLSGSPPKAVTARSACHSTQAFRGRCPGVSASRAQVSRYGSR
jgi:hypothetical protein